MIWRIGRYVEEDESWDTIYLDFAKAFDSVPHQRLLRKVSAYGIKGQLLSRIKDFLTERRQYVSVKGEVSSWKMSLVEYRKARSSDPSCLSFT